PQHAVGAEAAAPVAERGDQPRGERQRAVRVGQDHEVVARTVPLGECHHAAIMTPRGSPVPRAPTRWDARRPATGSGDRGGTRSVAAGRTVASPAPFRPARRLPDSPRQGTAAPAGTRGPGWRSARRAAPAPPGRAPRPRSRRPTSGPP